MTPLADAVARVGSGIWALERAATDTPKSLLVSLDDARTILAALPTPEERLAMDLGADAMLGADYLDVHRAVIRNYLNRTRTGGATDGE